MNTSEAKVPNVEGDWQSIEIFLFSNGQQYSPPRKYHLQAEELNWWEATLNHLARSHYGLQHPLIYLYTTDGHLVEGPLELKDGQAYVAVEPPESFIDAGYQKYLIRASRSWEKRQAKKKNQACEHEQPCCVCPEKEECQLHGSCCLCPEKEGAVSPEPLMPATGNQWRSPYGNYMSSGHGKTVADTFSDDHGSRLGKATAGEYGARVGEHRPRPCEQARPSEYEAALDENVPRPAEHGTRGGEYVTKLDYREDRLNENGNRIVDDTTRSGEYGMTPNDYSTSTDKDGNQTSEKIAKPIGHEAQLGKRGQWTNEVGSKIGKYELRSDESDTSLDESKDNRKKNAVPLTEHRPRSTNQVTGQVRSSKGEAGRDESDADDYGPETDEHDTRLPEHGSRLAEYAVTPRENGPRSDKHRPLSDESDLKTDEHVPMTTAEDKSERHVTKSSKSKEKPGETRPKSSGRKARQGSSGKNLDKHVSRLEKYPNMPGEHAGRSNELDDKSGKYRRKSGENAVEPDDPNDTLGEQERKVVENKRKGSKLERGPSVVIHNCLDDDEISDDENCLRSKGSAVKLSRQYSKISNLDRKGHDSRLRVTEQSDKNIEPGGRVGVTGGRGGERRVNGGEPKGKATDHGNRVSERIARENNNVNRVSEHTRLQNEQRVGQIDHIRRSTEPRAENTERHSRVGDPKARQQEHGDRASEERGRYREYSSRPGEGTSEETERDSRAGEPRARQQEHGGTASKERGREREHASRAGEQRARQQEYSGRVSDDTDREREHPSKAGEQRTGENDQGRRRSEQRTRLSNHVARVGEHETRVGDHEARGGDFGVRVGENGARSENPNPRLAEPVARVATPGARVSTRDRITPRARMGEPRLGVPGIRADEPVARSGESDIRDKEGEPKIRPGDIAARAVEPGIGGTGAAGVPYISEAQQHVRRSNATEGKTSTEKKRWSVGQHSASIRRPTPFPISKVPPRKSEDKKTINSINNFIPKKKTEKAPVAASNEIRKNNTKTIPKYPCKRIVPTTVPPPTANFNQIPLQGKSTSLTKVISNHKSLLTDSAPVENVIGNKEIIIVSTNLFRNPESEITSMRLDSVKHVIDGVKNPSDEIQTELIKLQQSIPSICVNEGVQTLTEHGHGVSSCKAGAGCTLSSQRDTMVTTDDPDENFISILNKGDVVNLKLNIEVRNGDRAANSCQKSCRKSRSLTNVTRTEKGSQISIEDDMYVQSKSLQSLLNNEYFRGSGFEGRPKVLVVQCACCGRLNNSPRCDPPPCCDSKKYFVLLPNPQQEDTDDKCICEPLCQPNSHKSHPQSQRASYAHPVRKTYSNMSLETVMVSGVPIHRRDIARFVTTTNSTCQTEEPKSECMIAKHRVSITENSGMRCEFQKESYSQISVTTQAEYLVTENNCPKTCTQICSQINEHVDFQMGSQAYAQPYTKVQSQLCPDVCPETCPRSRSHVCLQNCSQICLQTQSCPQACPQAQLQGYSQACPQVHSQECSQACPQAQSQGCPKACPQIQSQECSQACPQTQFQGCPKACPQVQSQGCSKACPQVQSQGYSQACPRVQSQECSQACPQAQSQLCSKTCPQAQSQVHSQVCSQTCTLGQSQGCPKTCPQAQSQGCPQVCTVTCPQIQGFPKVCPQIFLQVQSQVCPPTCLQVQSQTCPQIPSQGYPQISKDVSETHTQTQWCNVLLEARLHDDGRYSFHLPPLHVLKYYSF